MSVVPSADRIYVRTGLSAKTCLHLCNVQALGELQMEKNSTISHAKQISRSSSCWAERYLPLSDCAMTMLCDLELADPMDTTFEDEGMAIGVPLNISFRLPLLMSLFFASRGCIHFQRCSSFWSSG